MTFRRGEKIIYSLFPPLPQGEGGVDISAGGGGAIINSKEALKIILKYANPLGTEEVQITSALGRVLAEKVYSDVDIPPFNRSAMDGFAINSKDPSKTFEIIEDIPAGKVPQRRIRFGQAARIMTGAMLPRGADKVVKVEDTKLISNSSRFAGSRKTLLYNNKEAGQFLISNFERKNNASPRGEDVRKGQLVLKNGTKIRPQEAAMLATVGKSKVKVYRQPRVAIISTGSEIIEPDKKPGHGQIRNSNSSMLMLQLKRLGIDAKYLGIAKDDFSATEKLIKKGLRKSDILILSGGVSVGDYDFVADVLKKCGVNILFNKIAVKPGKPTTFGIKARKCVFGLPGNPVSVLVIFELLVVPFVDRLVGRQTKDKFLRVRLGSDFRRRNAEREQYFPVIFKDDGILPIKFHGSAHMQALTKATGLMRVPKGKIFIKKGTQVYARPI